jgi:hypothetical protein
MPAIDSCQPEVIRALEKEGWHILQSFFVKLVGQRGIYADLHLSKAEHQILIVEVKCFSGVATELSEFYQAVGQYLFYRNALALADIQSPIYLAVHKDIFDSLFQKPTIQATLNDAKINLVVVDLEKAEVTAWINSPK